MINMVYVAYVHESALSGSKCQVRVSATRYPTLIPKSSRMGRITIGVSAAPTAHEVTGQKEFGKCASEMSNLSLIARGALVTTAALKPTMKVLRRCQLDRSAGQGSWRGQLERAPWQTEAW